ncbi:MAG: AAA family ATPase [Providencia rustigianii]|uniref:AAA family ATPase n=1 Tax=Providencia rustigianii TaxID=158850 RepID=UPI003F3C5B20
MSDIQQRVIITGGPGAGKSAIIEGLITQKYDCLPESGRAIIQDQVRIGGSALPWLDKQAFAEMMLCWEIRSWHLANNNNGLSFFDRGLPDIAGYLQLCEIAVPKHLDRAIRIFEYQKTVFIAPPWKEIYVQDVERKQTFEDSVMTYHAMVSIYEQYNYKLIEIPCLSVDERVNFILSNMSQ